MMKLKTRKLLSALLIASSISVVGMGSVQAATFGTSSSGASSKEVLQIRYDGAAWNYKKSSYKSTSFRYKRNGRTLLSRTAYNGKVTGSVWDDLRWGDKYTTKFSWNRGAKR